MARAMGPDQAHEQAPAGATERTAWITRFVLSPLRGFSLSRVLGPTACAMGYILPPLRGSRRGLCDEDVHSIPTSLSRCRSIGMTSVARAACDARGDAGVARSEE